LGQNFLSNKNILEVMADAAELTKRDVVLEIGPGLGSLTEILAKRAKKVIAVEKDADLIPLLQEKFRDKKNVEIIHGDILRITPSFPLILRGTKEESAPLRVRGVMKYKIVANIPYYITSCFLRLFLSETKFRSKLMVLMVQKEVAKRICAQDGKESLLSLSVKAYGKPKIIRIVPRGAFTPAPNVDSAIIKIVIAPSFPLISRGTKESAPLNVRGARRVMKGNNPLGQSPHPPYFKGDNMEDILSLARLAFQKKRKMLRQSIGKKIFLPKNYETKRPEELSLKDWAKILRDPTS